MRSAVVWEQYTFARDQLQARIAEKIRRQMSSLVGNMESADLLLVAADGKKLPAHECILRARAPGFYSRHVDATVSAMGRPHDGRPREVAIGDIDSAALEFFIHSVYTEEEIAQFPTDADEDRRDSSRASNRSYAMDESTTELDFSQAGADEMALEEETPTTGRPPLAHHFQSGHSAQSSPRRVPPPPQQMSTSLTSQGSNMTSSVPMMTSFRDLASGSPMTSSGYSLGGRSEVADIPEEGEFTLERKPSRQEVSMSRFIRLDSIESSNDPTKEYLERKRSSGAGPKQIFPMFIGLAEAEMTPRSPVDTLRPGRIIMSKRLSMTSLTSLTSIDITPGHDVPPNLNDRTPASRLAADLMQMYLGSEDTDVIIKTETGDLHAHRCILSATCPFFRQQLAKSKRIEMKGFSKNAVNFLLTFLYGGLTTIPDEVDMWEVLSLATHLNHKDLVDVVSLHLKATICHWFHRPCASCVSAVFDALPQFATIRPLKQLYEEALAWQAKHFSRIWKGRVFIHLDEQWQKDCYEAVIQQMDDETIIDTILGCERLQAALPRSKSAAAVNVLTMVDDIIEVAMQVLLRSFHLIVTSNAFKQQGKGLALNLGLLEELLPNAIHSLSADVAIKAYKGLSELLLEIQSIPPSPKRGLSIPVDEYSTRFISLVRRMYENIDRHLLHYAASVVKADAWHLLNEQEQARIHETGLFVELRQPKAPPPRLSSFNRSYKRSASVEVQFNQGSDPSRSRSIDRGRPLSTIQQTVITSDVEMTSKEDVSEKAEKVIATESPRRSRRDQMEEVINTVPTLQPKPKESSPIPKESKIARPSSRPLSEERIEDKKEKKAERPNSAHDKKEREAKPVEPPKNEMVASASSSQENKRPPQPPLPQNTTTKTNNTKRTSPVKKKVIKSEEGHLERQVTHTIMTVDRAKLNLPGPPDSPAKVAEKPKSVVKPMVKDPPLAPSAPRTISRTTPKGSSTGSTGEIKPRVNTTRSAIPKITNAAKPVRPTRPSEGKGRPARPNNSIEK